jgi:cation-transporting P-type ATPase F
VLQGGDRVPADLRLTAAKGLQIDEAALTGESVPAHKQTDALPAETSLADRRNLAFAGTLVTAGQGEGVVFSIGDNTETGRIAQLISGAADLSTPLTRKIAEFSQFLLWCILGLAALTFLVEVIRGKSVAETFMAAVALAVGAIPEGLPAAMTIVLAIGVSRMAARRAIIRKLPAVETLGSTTIICSDKTGTLTQNEMSVVALFAGGQVYQVSGSGYAPEGQILQADQPVDLESRLSLVEMLRAGMLCNESTLSRHEGRWTIQGDPTEAALVVAATKAGLSASRLRHDWYRVDMIPFESEHMFRATLHQHADRSCIYLVGALERLLDRCAHQLATDGTVVDLDVDQIRAAADQMASDGLRVLGIFRRSLEEPQPELAHADVACGLTFLGLQGMLDPPRPEVISAIARCQSAGIQVKMITGDHIGTASAIAHKIGLGNGDIRALSGKDLETISDRDLPDIAMQTAVFARVAPEQKLRLVTALQARGNIVAMTGDGVNDAPALKQADIGIAMGITGTEVSKNAADMILTDDNFASIEAAVEEGRGVFDNLVKFIVWTLPTNAGEAVILLLAILLSMQLPALPVQLLWINMTTSILLGLTLVFEPRENNLMARPPRDSAEPILTFALLMRTGFVCLIMAAGAFWVFHVEMNRTGNGIERARTAVINVIVLVECGYLLNCRSLIRSFYHIGPFSNPIALGGIALMILAQLAFTYTPLMNRLFHTAPIEIGAWVRILLVTLTIFAIVEFEKWVRRTYGTR